MGWIEGILEFLRQGPTAGKLDINALFAGAVSVNQLDKDAAIKEIDALVSWQEARKKWHQDKTRQKMAAEGTGLDGQGLGMPGTGTGIGAALTSSDFGVDQMDLQDMNYEDESASGDEDESDDELDPISAERKRRARKQGHLRRTAGEPAKPEVQEVQKLDESFLVMLRMVLAE